MGKQHRLYVLWGLTGVVNVVFCGVQPIEHSVNCGWIVPLERDLSGVALLG